MPATLRPSELQQIDALVAKARRYARSDPEVALGQARKAAEAIARAVFAREIGEPGKIMLDAMLQKLAAAKAIPAGVLVPFGTIQAYGNYGAHAHGDARPVDASYAAPALSALEHVATWFRTDYEPARREQVPQPTSNEAAPVLGSPSRRTARYWLAGALVVVVVAAGLLARRSTAPRSEGAAPVESAPNAAVDGGAPAHESNVAPGRVNVPGPERRATAGTGSSRASAAGPLSLDLAVLAAPAGEQAFRALRPGEALFEGAHLAFRVRVSTPAFVYLCQRSNTTGAISVLFPDDRIGLRNPIEPGEWLRIPKGNASFRVDDKDLGIETVFAIASPTPIERLDQALQKLGRSGDARAQAAAERELLAVAAEGNDDCDKTRGLSLETGGCGARARGIVLEQAPDEQGQGGGTSEISARRRATRDDPRVLIPFSFKHVAAPRR
jgi:Domain of unknown function (DUF4384)